MIEVTVNGEVVSLPDIPSDVLATYPYAVILYVTTAGVYLATAATGQFGAMSVTNAVGFQATAWTAGYSPDVDTWSDEITMEDGGWLYLDELGAEILLSNHDILEVDVNFAQTGEVYFAANWTLSDPYYAAPKSWYDGMAQQVMRLSETTSKLTTDAMLSALKGVEAGGEELPNAEDYAFGEEAVDGREAISFNSASGSLSTKYTFGLRFTAAEAFQIVGFAYAKDGIYIWDADENLVKEVSYTANSGTYTYELDEPFVVNAGETYTIGSRFYNSHPYVNISACAFDAALGTVTAWVSRTGSLLYPENSTTYIPAITMTIASIAAEDDSVPKTYQIMLGTMTEIAEEVKRISGTELDKLTPAQIITALQGVT